MFDLNHAINDWRHQMAVAGLDSPAALDELESHLREHVAHQMRSGVSAQNAFEAAVKSLGPAPVLQAEFAKLGESGLARKRRFVRIACVGSAAFILLVSAWTFLEFDLGPIERLLGFLMVWPLALYIGWLPFSLRLQRAPLRTGVNRAIKLVGVLVQLWVLFALLNALEILHAQFGIIWVMALWSLYAAYGATLLMATFVGPLGTESTAPDLTSFAPSAKEALAHAREEAASFNHDFIGTEHLLLGLFQTQSGGPQKLLKQFGLEKERVRAQIENLIGAGSTRDGARPLPFTPRARKAITLAAREAGELNHPAVGAEHLLLGLCLENSGVAALVLQQLDIRAGAIREAILRQLGPDGSDGPQSAKAG